MFLLLFLYESSRMALSILAMPLLAVSAVFVSLWFTGIELNISATMGMTMIVGIVTKTAAGVDRHANVLFALRKE